MKGVAGKFIDNNDQESYSAKMRRKRFTLFQSLLQNLSTPIKILDVGGVQRFWEVMGFVDVPEVHITLLNLKEQPTTYNNFLSVVGDATNMKEFDDAQFDVVFSNSVIEHVGSFDKQKAMAKEVQRVGKHYFVQLDF